MHKSKTGALKEQSRDTILIKRRLTKILQNINDTRRSGGLFAAILQTLMAIRKLFFFRGDAILFVRPVQEPPADVKTIPEVTVRELRDQDLTLLEPAVEQSVIEWYKLLLAKGRTCLLALKDGQPAAYIWLTPQIDPQLERIYAPLEPGDIYVIEIRTLPAFQRQGFQKIMLKHLIEWAQDKGYDRIVDLVSTHRNISLKMHDKLGYQPISRMTRTRILILVHFCYKPNLFGKAGNIWILYR